MDRIQDHGVVDDTAVTRPVTDRSRITGARTVSRPAYGGTQPLVESKSLDWHAVVASVVTGLAVTVMLVILGVATGLISGNENTDSASEIGGILGAVGAWSVVAMVIGAFVGSLLGGRLARWLDRGSIGYHALTSWGLATLLALTLATLVTIGFSEATNAAANSTTATETVTDGQADDATNPAGGAAAGTGAAAEGTPEGPTGTDATSKEEAADNTADALGGAGLGIFFSMLLTLAASAAGWWIGSRKRLLDIEREPEDSHVAA